ncbi:hypothetical protein B0H13DRAFT_2378137 [Mycena leptocephala]|nr:hypothetical protein B0H13DRAFT_2378137 [Mycena leptocephala]
MFVQLLRSAGTVDATDTLQDIQVAFQHLRQVKNPWKDLIVLVNNFAADGLFVSNVSLPPIFPINNIIAVSSCLVTTNLLLTGLTAGRIWWTRRHLRVIGEPKLAHRYKTAIKMLFESSLLYFVIFLVYLLMDILGSPATIDSPVVVLLSGASPQLMNIMPALVIVRVSLARSVDTDPTAGNLKVESSVY